jgi:U3 small nucleolar RNA-associated protein 20
MKDEDAPIEPEYKKKSLAEMKEETVRVIPKWIKGHQGYINEKLCGKVLAGFGLQCLWKSFKALDYSISKDRLEPFVKQFLWALDTSDNQILINALKIISAILPLKLATFELAFKKFIAWVFRLFNNSIESWFMNSLFAATQNLFHVYSGTFTPYQLDTILDVIKGNLDHYAMQANVYGLLKSIVDKGTLNPKVYDLIEIIQEKLINNGDESVRKTCAKIFEKFLLTYPLSEKRVEQHFYFILRNIEYEESNGWFTVLNVISTLINKFP